MRDEEARQERSDLLARHLPVEHGGARFEGLMEKPPRPARRGETPPEAPAVLRLLGEEPQHRVLPQQAIEFACHIALETGDPAALDPGPFTMRSGHDDQSILATRADDLRFLAANDVGDVRFTIDEARNDAAQTCGQNFDL